MAIAVGAGSSLGSPRVRCIPGRFGRRRPLPATALAIGLTSAAVTVASATAASATSSPDRPSRPGNAKPIAVDALPAAIPTEDRAGVADEIAAVMAVTPPGRLVALELGSGAVLHVLLSGLRPGADGMDCRAIDYRYEAATTVAAAGERCRTPAGEWLALSADVLRQPGAASPSPAGLPRPSPRPSAAARAGEDLDSRITALLAELRYLPTDGSNPTPAQKERAIGDFVNDEGLAFPLSEHLLLNALESAAGRSRTVDDCVPRGGPALCLRAGERPASLPESHRP